MSQYLRTQFENQQNVVLNSNSFMLHIRYMLSSGSLRKSGLARGMYLIRLRGVTEILFAKYLALGLTLGQNSVSIAAIIN